MADKFRLKTRLPRNFQGSLTCRKSATWDRRLYFPSEGTRAEEFFARKIRRLRPGLNPHSWVPEVLGVFSARLKAVGAMRLITYGGAMPLFPLNVFMAYKRISLSYLPSHSTYGSYLNQQTRLQMTYKLHEQP